MDKELINLEWFKATLADAGDALNEAIDKLEEADQEEALDVYSHELANVYAKLNYALNTAHLGPEALDALTEDELIAWPINMPFCSYDELWNAGKTSAQAAEKKKG